MNEQTQSNALTQYVAQYTTTSNPFKVRVDELKTNVEKLVITVKDDVNTAKMYLTQAQDLAKQIKEARESYTDPMDDAKKQILALVKQLTDPIQEVKDILNKKMLDYKAEQDRLAEIERQRILEICHQIRSCTELKDIKGIYDRLTVTDQGKAEIKLAVIETNNQIQAKIKAEEEAKRRAEEEDRLAKIKAEQDAEAAKIAEERVKIEQEKRELAAQKEAQKRQEEIDRQAKKALNEEAKSFTKISGLTERWTFEIINEDEIPRQFCIPDDKKINEAIKNGVREIPGIRIYKSQKVV